MPYGELAARRQPLISQGTALSSVREISSIASAAVATNVARLPIESLICCPPSFCSFTNRQLENRRPVPDSYSIHSAARNHTMCLLQKPATVVHLRHDQHTYPAQFDSDIRTTTP